MDGSVEARDPESRRNADQVVKGKWLAIHLHGAQLAEIIFPWMFLAGLDLGRDKPFVLRQYGRRTFNKRVKELLRQPVIRLSFRARGAAHFGNDPISKWTCNPRHQVDRCS